MKEKRCIIVGAGDFFGLSLTPGKEDLIIAADAGYDRLISLQITPDLTVGDFDSRGRAPEEGPVVKLPRIKDDTDLGAAVKIGLERGFLDFRIFGGTGGRFDHTMANIQLLAHIAEEGGRGFLYGKGMVMTVIHNGAISLGPAESGTVSVFSLSDRSEGVNISGLFYELKDGVLTNTFSLGVSNEFIGEKAGISVRKGFLLVTWEED